MRRLIHFSLFVAALVITGCTATGTVKDPAVHSEYDKFEDQTVYTTTEARVYGGMGLNTHFIWMTGTTICEGDEPCKADGYGLRFRSSSDGWALLDNYKLIIIADGERFEFNEEDLIDDRDVMHGSTVREFITAVIPAEDFYTIAFADKVEARLGSYELDMSNERRRTLRMIASETD